MKTHRLRFIADLATAALWRIEDHVRAGMTFTEAKERVMEESASTWRGLSKSVAADVSYVVANLAPSDVHKTTRDALRNRLLADIEAQRGRKAGKVERLLYRLTGYVF